MTHVQPASRDTIGAGSNLLLHSSQIPLYGLRDGQLVMIYRLTPFERQEKTMHVAQSGIFALGTSSHAYLEFDLHPQSDPLQMVQIIASLEEPRMTTGGVNLVVGVRPSLWSQVAPDEMPPETKDFDQDLQGVDGYSSFGTATEHGTMFIGFSCEQYRLARMLARMAGAEDGIRDALTRYTTAVSGAYYFTPSVEALRRFASPED
jgi:deferrochelatase/peroxidase EfeB